MPTQNSTAAAQRDAQQTGAALREQQRRMPLAQRESQNLDRLNELLRVAAASSFYRERLEHISLPLQSLSEFSRVPLLNKSEIVPIQRGGPVRIFDRGLSEYCRFHQTSGTSGFPMPVLDSADDWAWWIHCWQYVLDAADVSAEDVAMMAFSFGPFIGFWTAHDALIARGATVIPGGGMSSEARLQMIFDHRCTVVCCTPTYALHLAAVAQREGRDLASGPVRRIIVAGEPGGSIRTVRERIEQAWGATLVDHTGASELGAWGFGSGDGLGIHVIESEFVAELLCFDDDQQPTGRVAQEGEAAELVLTNLGRYGGPAIRYRTGDIVRGYRDHDRDCRFLWLDGGVLGRSDDMMVIRGVNVFPSSIEAIVREIAPTAEFRMIATRRMEMDQLDLELEGTDREAKQLADLLRHRLAMRVTVTPVPDGKLPRFEAKSRRWVDRRESLTSNTVSGADDVSSSRRDPRGS